MSTGSREKELFERAAIPRAVMELAVPTIIGQIILVIYNMADTFYIGLSQSDVMITSVTVCMPAFMFLSAISNLFGIGGAGAISRALGRGERKKASDACRFSFWGCLLAAGLYVLGVYLFKERFIGLLGGHQVNVKHFAGIYLRYTVILGGIPTAMGTLLSHLLRSEGVSRQAGFGVALGGVLNIVLDPLFMFVIFPKGNEVRGAAIATALSNAIALVYFAVVIYRRRKGSVLKFSPDRGMFEKSLVSDIIVTGTPACVMTLFENISYAVLDNIISAYGVTVQAGIGVAKKINMLAHSIVRGMSQGVLPLIGYNYSSGNHRRMKSAILFSMSVSVILSLICTGVSIVFAKDLVGFFLSNAASGDWAAVFLRILCVGCPFSACAYAFISFFQAVGCGGRSFILAIMRKGVLDIPMMFIFDRIEPCRGAAAATPAADVLCCIAAIMMFALFMKKHTELSD